MAYQLELDETVGAGLRRIALERIDHALSQIEDPEVDRPAAVHEVRKDCKRIRGLLRLVRPAASDLYRTENRHFRDTARRLSGLRDAEAAVESFDKLASHFAAILDSSQVAHARQALTAHKERVVAGMEDLDGRLAAVAEALRDARERAADWRVGSDGDRVHELDLVGPGLQKTYKRGVQAMSAAYVAPSVTAFHEWRKRAKYLRYHTRLLRKAWPAVMRPTRKQAKILSDLLGDDHDLAVLQPILETTIGPGDDQLLEALEALIARRSQSLRDNAYWLGRRLYAERPGAMRERLGGYWVASKEQACV